MTKLTALVLFLAHLALSHAASLNSTTGMTAMDVPPTMPAPTLFSNWDALLSALGLSTARQAEAAVLSQMMTSFLGLLATGKIIPFLAPVIVSYIVLPIMALMKSLAKGLLFIGVAAWLISTIIPFGLAYFGLAGAGAFVSRTFQNTAGPYAMYVDMGPKSLITKALQMLDMDNVECRMQLACKSGEWTQEFYPAVVTFMNHTGLLATAEEQARYEPYSSLAVKALRGTIDCNRELAQCGGLNIVESALDPRHVANVSSQWVASYLEPPTTTTAAPTFFGNDAVVGALRRFAQNYYSL